MKLCDISYEEAKKRHPEKVSSIINTLRKSRSKEKNSAPEELKWSYETCIQVMGFSFTDMISGKMREAQNAQEAMTFEARVEDEFNRTSTVLQATRNRWIGQEIVPNPPEVRENIQGKLKNQEKENREFESLSEEEKENQRKEALEYLSKQPGFMVISAKMDETKKDMRLVRMDGRKV